MWQDASPHTGNRSRQTNGRTDRKIYIHTDRQCRVGECNSFIPVPRSLASCKCVHSWVLPGVSVWLTLHLLHLCSRKQAAACSNSSSSLRDQCRDGRPRKKDRERKSISRTNASQQKWTLKQLFKRSEKIFISTVQCSQKKALEITYAHYFHFFCWV